MTYKSFDYFDGAENNGDGVTDHPSVRDYSLPLLQKPIDI
jgi:hypothetical protein